MAIFKKKQPLDVPRRRREQPGMPTAPEADQQRRFLRNRTLSGPSSWTTIDESDRTHVHRLTHQRRRLGGIFFFVVLFVVALVGLISQLTASVTVTTSDVSISRPLEAARYEKTIDDYLNGRPIERLRFMLNEGSLTMYLREQLPEVDIVSSGSFDGVGNTRFVLSVRRPVAGWQINGRQFFVDNKGVAFERNYYANPNVQIIDQSGVSLGDGGAVTSIRFLEFLGLVVAFSQTAGYTVTEAILPLETTRQLQVRLKDVPSLIKFSIDRGVGEQVEDMSRSLRYLRDRNLTAEYVDVRVPGKAYYK